jgi:alkanesulfonate monooxygenase SsuD/methylene tetrahydromethanopterin reductase-like flavin-dependent oxidoreductase (luciferase family)
VKTPAGNQPGELWANLCAGRPSAEVFDDPRLPPGTAALVCRVNGFDPAGYLTPAEARRLDRSHALAIGAAADALGQCTGLPEPARRAVVCGVGLGAASTYDALGIPYGESQARFEEALAILREAWKGEPFSYQGRFHRITNTVVTPRPYQLPHPPLRMAANSPETFPWVGRAGLPLFVGVRDLDIPELRVHVESYRAAWRQAGHAGSGDVYLRLPVYAAPTEEAALEEPRENILYFFRRHTELARARLGRAGAGPTERIQARVADLSALSYDRILETRVAFGTAASLIRRLGAVRDDLGLDGIIAELNPGGLLPMELQRRTLELLAREVIPAIR